MTSSISKMPPDHAAFDQLAADLSREFPTMRGFFARNLKYMRAFAEA